ncbi:putative deoxyribonuclease TATDN3 isoform X2 [Lingula anatina]|uniref:Deoxyribonuclease TATDN3 isoform X2 n=1 Tax=Lingula anatina TaxID=7574 RepID=A0A1S3JK23_LINAN|nr:putative deoxyribonuclease TATDN3 isoform X2 [Lingula anatina]|eukprot:XP_013410770.1 putative deoxyribonuclease TATDN3 isoform X2 [Lingula anatina]
MAIVIDAHCHLAAEEFDEDIDDVITKGKEAGIAAAVVVPEHFGEFQKVLDLAERYPDFIAPCLGVHPVQGSNPNERSACLEDLDEANPFIEKHHDKIVGIGEVGLDFTPWYIKMPQNKEDQRNVFIKQIDIAKKYDLPVNVHSRSAGNHAITLLKEQGVSKALLHAFSGRASVAMEGVQAGYYFSFPPVIVRSEQQKLLARLPLDCMLLETDSPACGPEKGERNVPANITLSCEYIAQVKKVDKETVMRITTENALKLFPKLKNFVKL